MKNYNYFRSGTSHRLRIALNIKGVNSKYIPVNLRTEAHLQEEFTSLNPQRLVPVLILESGEILTQSPAIIEWLEERYPHPSLLPFGAEARSHVRALASLISCDIHPINNRRILEYLRRSFNADEAAINQWCGQWISSGFDAYEALLAHHGNRGRYSWGCTPTLADVYLVPQVESARRFQVDITRWPRIYDIDAACAELPEFVQASPWMQPDTEATRVC